MTLTSEQIDALETVVTFLSEQLIDNAIDLECFPYIEKACEDAYQAVVVLKAEVTR